MKRLLLILLTTLILVNLFAQSKVVQKTVKRGNMVYIVDNNREYPVLDVISVKYADLADLQKKYDVIRYNKLNNADLKVPPFTAIEDYVSLLEQDDNLVWIDYNSEGDYESLIPNDFYWNDMWHLEAIRAPEAWSLTTGSPSVKVAILDSGTDWMHPDLGFGSDSYQNIYCNPLENDWSNLNNPATGNQIDDDSNGLIDDYKGWNFDANSNDARGTYYHGTFVAGVIGAKTNNSIGVSGVAGGNYSNGVSLLPYCVGVNAPNTSVIDDAIIAAVDNGARVIQFSLSCGSTNAIKAALQYAKTNNVIVVCASGNNYNSALPFPASDTTVIAVGAINFNYQRANFSNYGSNLRLVAPGVIIRGLNLSSANSLYLVDDGTSFAAPQVSGVIALMLSLNPLLNRNEVIYIIESSTQKVGGYAYLPQQGHPNGTWNEEMGYGLVDAAAAVWAALNTHIQGPDTLCDTENYQLLNCPPTATVRWSYTTNIQQQSSPVITFSDTTTTTTTVTRGSFLWQLYSGMVTLQATVTFSGVTKVFTKNILLHEDVNPTIPTYQQFKIGLNETRTFTINNCSGVPYNKLKWRIHKPLATDTITHYGFNWSITASEPDVNSGILNIRLYNLQNCDTSAYSNYNIRIDYHQIIDPFDPLLLFPNPVTTNTVEIQVVDQSYANRGSNETAEERPAIDYTLELWDENYGLLKTVNSSISGEKDIVTLDLSNLRNGVYFLVLKVDNQVVKTDKLIISR